MGDCCNGPSRRWGQDWGGGQEGYMYTVDSQEEVDDAPSQELWYLLRRGSPPAYFIPPSYLLQRLNSRWVQWRGLVLPASTWLQSWQRLYLRCSMLRILGAQSSSAWLAHRTETLLHQASQEEQRQPPPPSTCLKTRVSFRKNNTIVPTSNSVAMALRFFSDGKVGHQRAPKLVCKELDVKQSVRKLKPKGIQKQWCFGGKQWREDW